MRFLATGACLGFALVALLPPLSAQGGAVRPAPGVPRTDQEQSGEAFFYQRCPLCHVYTARTAAARSRTDLVGLYKQPSITDEAVRALVMAGMPGRMPSFRYTFTPKELDDLIAYLKIR